MQGHSFDEGALGWVGTPQILHVQGCFATWGTLMKTLPTVLGCRAGGGTWVELLPVGLLP